MSPRSLVLVGLPMSFTIVLAIFWGSTGFSLGQAAMASGAVTATGVGILSAARALHPRPQIRPTPETPMPPHRPRRRALTYREGGRAHGAPWGLLLAEGDPYAISALDAYAAAASAAGEEDVAGEVRELASRWRERLS